MNDTLRDAPPKPAKPASSPSPDDGPEDMELTVVRKRGEALDTAGNAFDTLVKTRFGGIDTRMSAFEKGALFRTEE
ncbi:MAG: hypothetical protein LBS24_04945 [Clostridiales Family XIII bacterium]|nr:hypothetical protein [Clostridiales Family XIII bacterium]